jgi:hypothetical protein
MNLRLRIVTWGLIGHVALTVVGCGSLTSEQLGDILNGGGPAPLDTETVVAGLKEALKVGTDRTVADVGKLDGYWGNALIRIVMPEELQSMASTLRSVGLGGQVDQFELAMNRGAEQAAALAAPVFWDAITKISFADAWAILRGDDSAATTYFRAQTTATLTAQFRPKVQEQMQQVGLYKVYNHLLETYSALPLVSRPEFDLDGYITDQALGGLFTVLAGEEKRIRDDPVARTTDLLRRVFGASP